MRNIFAAVKYYFYFYFGFYFTPRVTFAVKIIVDTVKLK